MKTGFTLVEMTVVIIFALALSTAGMMLLNQQINTTRIFNRQNFILTEAPRINTSLSALLGRADAIRIHNKFSDAVNDLNPVSVNGSALVLAFRNIDNTTSFGIINFVPGPALANGSPGPGRINYHYSDPSNPPTQGNPSWTISSDITNVDFDLVGGLFQVTLTGPNTEQITYAISPNQ